jgi:hypothetical protein
VQAARRILQFGDLVQQGARALAVFAAGLGEAQAARRAVDQPDPEVVLQFLDQPAHRRSRHVEVARRRRQAAERAGPVEHLHRRQKIHRRSSPEIIAALPATAGRIKPSRWRASFTGAPSTKPSEQWEKLT